MEFGDQNNKKEEPIDLNDFILQDRIGQGSFGRVYRVKEKKNK